MAKKKTEKTETEFEVDNPVDEFGVEATPEPKEEAELSKEDIAPDELVDEETGEILAKEIEDQVTKEAKAETLEILKSKIIKLSDVQKSLSKHLGKTTEGGKALPAFYMASDHAFTQVPRIPSGVLSFDYCTYGGIPQGMITEMFGMESSSKTTMALRVCGKAQGMGLLPAWIDFEGTLDQKWASKFVDLDNLILSRPETGEEGLEIVDGLIRSGSTDLIVIDSVAAMTPTKEITNSFGDVTVGVHAKLMNMAMRKWVSSQHHAFWKYGTRCTIILINQIRMKIGVMYGNPETTTGGMGQNFAKALSIKMWKGKEILDEETKKPIMVDMNMRVVKSKVSPPFITGAYPMMLRDTGFKGVGDVYDEEQLVKLAKKYEFLVKKDKTIFLQLSDKLVDLECRILEDIPKRLLKDKATARQFREEILNFLIEL